MAATYNTDNKHKRITSMPSAEFKPAIPKKSVQLYALDRMATRIGLSIVTYTL